MRLRGPALSSYWQLGGALDCAAIMGRCVRLRAEISQPVRVEHGTFAVSLAEIPADYLDDVTFSSRAISATPSGRQTDLRAIAATTVRGGELVLEAFATRQPGNLPDAPSQYGLVARLSHGF